MQKAVSLLRASSPRQEKSGLGLDAQKWNVDQFAAITKRKIIAEFVEVGSGLKKNRPIIEAALKVCRETGATLLIANMDRLTRRLLFVVLLMESDIKFICVDKPNAGRLELLITAMIAENESLDIGRRTKEALRVAKTNGVKLGTSVFGLIRRKRQEYKAFAKRMKPIIRRFQKMGLTTTRQLVDALNDMHVKTFQGHDCRWHNSTVHRLLKTI